MQVNADLSQLALVRHADLAYVASPSAGVSRGMLSRDGDEVPEAHTGRMELFATVMAQDTANMGPIQASVASSGIDAFHIGWHERLIHHFHRAVDLAIGATDVPDGLAVSDALDGYVVD